MGVEQKKLEGTWGNQDLMHDLGLQLMHFPGLTGQKGPEEPQYEGTEPKAANVRRHGVHCNY